MISFKINGKALVLLPGTEVSLVFANAALSDDLQDDFSLPFTVPVRGNEMILASVHDLAIHERITVFRRVVLEYNGVAQKTGDLYVEQVNETRISLSFSITGFISALKGIRLPEMDMGEAIQTNGVRDYAKAVNLEAWPQASCCFPMYYAPQFYGDENPDWMPRNAKEWEPGESYVANDIVTDTYGSPVAYEFTYQRKYGSGAVTPPAITPSIWRRTSFGIVNHWDWTTEAFLENTTTENFYSMSPCFYLKYILQKAFASLGYTVGGSFFADPRYDRLFLYNNTALDSGSQSAYFLAHQTGTISAPGTPPPPVRVPGQDDINLPNQDPTGVWDPVNMRWQCPSAGSFTFRVYVPYTPGPAPDILKIAMMREGTPDVEIASANHSSVLMEDHNLSTFTINMAAGNVGMWYYFSAKRYNPEIPFALHGCWIEGWKNESSVINQFSNNITPARHVPDMEFAELLLDLKALYGIKVTVDAETAHATLNYAQGVLNSTPVDITKQVRSSIDIDIASRAAGVTWAWEAPDSGGEAPDVSLLIKQGEYASYADVPTAAGPGLYCLVLADRRLLVSRFDAVSGYVWYQTGHLLAPYTIGDSTGAEKRPKLAPLPSATVGVQLQEFLVPAVQDKCTSAFFTSAKGQASLLAGFFHGMQPNMDGTLYPYASSYRYRMDGTPIPGVVEMDWTSDHGPIASHQQQLAEAQVFADPLTCDLEVDMDFIVARKHETLVLVQGQRCLITSLPITLTDGKGVIIAKKAKLLKLRN